MPDPTTAIASPDPTSAQAAAPVATNAPTPTTSAATVAAPSVTAPVVTGIPMLDDKGKPVYVPPANAQKAMTEGGYKLSVNMTDPQGKQWHVPFDQQDRAQKEGKYTWDADADNESLKKYVASLPADFSLRSAIAGPNTALATPVSPEWNQEGSGVSDILHGNIGQGAGKIWEAEKPHVIKGSFIEKAIQKLDPSFQGDVTNDQVAAHAATYNATERPAVDVAQFIDKSKSPVKKAIAETAQSFTSPANVATLYATGGLGLVESPAALSMASRLISGGFSAAAIGQMYNNFKGFKAAYDAGDENEAIYQATHLVLSGALAAVAAHGAASDTPLSQTKLVNPFRKAAQATADAVQATGDFGKQVVQGEKVAQGPAQEALRTAAQAVTPASSTAPTSLRTALEQPIATVFANAKGLYRAVDQASGVDFKDLNDKLENAEYQIGQSADGSPEEAKWEQARTNIMDKIADAKQKALNAGVDPKTLDQADAEFTRARALQDLQTKVFKNPSIVEGNSAQGTDETINVDAAIKAIQRLQDTTKYGAPRLEQALGKDAANAFLESLYDAQRTGAKAVSRQQLLGTVWKVAKGAGYATGIYEVVKHLLGGD
jgi:hypothetical protein